MTDWELVLKNEHPTDKQIDEVGNIYQKGGGVNPKACQKCHQEFNAPTKKIALVQDTPSYTCSDCSFKNDGSQKAMDHMITTKHKIIKKLVPRTVGYENIIVGPKVMVDKIYKDGEVVDVNILCADCFNLEAFRKRTNYESKP